MSVTVTERPLRTVNELTTPEQISRWMAVWHPILFKFQRKDFLLTAIAANGGTGDGVELTVDGDASELEVGDFIYLYEEGVFDGSYEVLSISTTGSPVTETTIVIDAEYSVTTAVTGFINILSRLAYFLEVRILEYTTGAPVETTDEYPQFTSNASGVIKADLQKWLQPLLAAVNEYDYLQTSVKDENLGQPFNIQYREFWRGVGYGEWSDLTDDNLHYIANAVKQTGDLYGQNIGEYVIFPLDTASPQVEGSAGKFLTKFTEPVFWEGYPFSLSFVYSDEYSATGDPISKVERVYDLNGDAVSASLQVLINYAGFINRMILVGGYASSATRVCVSLQAPNDDAYVEEDYVYADYVDSVDGELISERLCIKLNDGCVNNPEYLAWLNPAGGFDYWLFSSAQDFLDKVDNEQLFERYTEDLATATARDNTKSKDSQEEIILGAEGLTSSQAEGLRYLLASPLVLRFRGYDETTLLPKWQRVGVKPGTFLIHKTDEYKRELICTILPPQKYVQEQ